MSFGLGKEEDDESNTRGKGQDKFQQYKDELYKQSDQFMQKREETLQ